MTIRTMCDREIVRIQKQGILYEKMLKLKHPHDEPPGGWWYRDPEMDAAIRAGTLSALIDAVIQRRRVNALPVADDLPARIEHQICLRIPLELIDGSQDEKGRIVKSPAARALHTAAKLTQDFLGAWKHHDMAMCDPATAEARAKQCLSCANHARVSYCIGCNGFDSWIYGWLGGQRRTNADKNLTVCMLDGCLLMALVHANNAPLQSVLNFDYPASCWKRKGTA